MRIGTLVLEEPFLFWVCHWPPTRKRKRETLEEEDSEVESDAFDIDKDFEANDWDMPDQGEGTGRKGRGEKRRV